MNGGGCHQTLRASSTTAGHFRRVVTPHTVCVSVVELLLLLSVCSAAAQQVRVDFVHEFAADVVDMAVSGDGRVFLLDKTAVVSVLDSFTVTQTIDLSQQGTSHTVGEPRCLAIDAEGTIFVGDGEKGQILRFDRSGRYLGRFGPSANSETRLFQPAGLACDHFGRLYVADEKGAVLIYTYQGIYLGRLPGFSRPVDVGVDGLGNLYVLESREASVHVYDPHLTLLTTLKPGDDPGLVLSAPAALFVESDGTVYVADRENCRISVLKPAVQPELATTYYAQMGVKGEGRGEFRQPIAVSIDGEGRLYVADARNRNVQIFTLVGLSEVKRELKLPSLQDLPLVVEWIADVDHSSVPDSRGVWSFALDDEGNIYCVDVEQSAVSVYTWAGSFVTSFGGEGTDPGRLKRPEGALWDKSRMLYVLDTGNNRVQQWSDTGVFQRQFGKKGNGPSEFNNPCSAEFDDQGDLLIADKNNNRLHVAGPDGEFKRILTGERDNPLKKPIDVAVGPTGRMYILEEKEKTVRVLDGDDWSLWTIDGGEEERSTVPVSVDVGADATVYVLDSRAGVSVFNRDGRLTMRFGSEGDLIGQFRQPTHVEIGPGGKIYVSDAEHNRISLFRLGNSSEGAVAGRVVPPPQSGTVTLRRRGQPLKTAALRHDGTFLMRSIPPDEYAIAVEAPGYEQWTEEPVIVASGRLVRGKPITLRASGSIAGVLIPTIPHGHVLLKRDLKLVAETAVSPEDGSFAFLDMSPGEYKLEVRAEGFVAPQRAKKIRVVSGGVVTDTTRLRQPGSVSGTVTPPDCGAIVTVLRDEEEIALVAARWDNGAFESTGLYPGRYTLVVSAQEYVEQAVEDVDVEEGQEFDVGTIELQKVKRTSPQARYLIGEGKRLHLSAEFEQAQRVLLQAITTQEMADQDLSEAYLWLAYSYFPFAELRSEMEETLTECVKLDPNRVLGDGFSPPFRQAFEMIKERVRRGQED